MKFIQIQRNVLSGQCKNALLRIQVGYTAIYFFSGVIPGWAGTKIGVFAPVKGVEGYVRKGFYFQPWLARDVAVSRLPRWYVRVARALSFEIGRCC